MADTTESPGVSDNDRYDNDFEKIGLPRNGEETVSSSTEASEMSSSGEAVRRETSEAEPAVRPSSSPVAEPAETGCPAKTASCSSCCCMNMIKNVDPRVKDLVLWRDVKKSGIVFASSLVVLISLALFSVLSVVSYLSLAVMTITFSFRFYWYAMCTVKKTTEENPLKKYMNTDLTVNTETAHRYADIIAKHLTKTAEELRRLFFVENVVDSLKFVLVLWLLTYIGGWFNGITLLIIGDVVTFSLPKVYDMYQTQIDNVAGQICVKTRDVWKKVEDKIPALSKKKQA